MPSRPKKEHTMRLFAAVLMLAVFGTTGALPAAAAEKSDSEYPV